MLKTNYSPRHLLTQQRCHSRLLVWGREIVLSSEDNKSREGDCCLPDLAGFFAKTGLSSARPRPGGEGTRGSPAELAKEGDFGITHERREPGWSQPACARPCRDPQSRGGHPKEPAK